MTTSVPPFAKLEWMAQKASENLLFYETRVLLEVAQNNDGEYSDETEIPCAAELIVRRFLNPNRVNHEELNRIFSNEEWCNLEGLRTLGILGRPREKNIPEKLWTSHFDFSNRCEIAIRHRLTRVDFFSTGKESNQELKYWY